LRRSIHPRKSRVNKRNRNLTKKGGNVLGDTSNLHQRSEAKSFSPEEKEPVLVRGKLWKNTSEDRWELHREQNSLHDSSLEGLIKRLEQFYRVEGRCSAAESLGQKGTDAIPAIPALLNSAVDKNAAVREASLKALNTISPTWQKFAETQMAIPSLVTALKNQPPDVIKAATSLLESIGSTAVPSLEAALLAGEDTVDKVYVLRALARIGPDAENAVTGIIRALSSNYVQVRVAAAEALAIIGPTLESIPALMAGLTDPIANARETMATCLGRAGVIAEPAAPALLPLLADRESRVRNAAVKALEQIGPPAVPVLIEVVKTRDLHRFLAWVKERNEVLQWLEEPQHDMRITNPVESYTNLTWAALDILENRECRELAQEAAIQVLGKLGTAAASTATDIAEALKDPNPRIRLAAVRALGQIGAAIPTAEKVVAGLIQTLVDSNKSVQDESVKVIKLFDLSLISEPLVFAAIKRIQKYLDNPGEFAVQAFAAIGASSVPILVDTLESGNRVARENAARALGLIGPEAQSAIPMLSKALQDSHPWVQAEAAKALAQVKDHTTY
jgi:HEAT repeat protein